MGNGWIDDKGAYDDCGDVYEEREGREDLQTD